MHRSVSWTLAGAVALGLPAFSRQALTATRPPAQNPRSLLSAATRMPGTPYQIAMREAAIAWHGAVQLASEEQDTAHQAVRHWDPIARSDTPESLSPYLAKDDGGYVRQAQSAIQAAVRLAATPADRQQAEQYAWRWRSTPLHSDPL